MTCSGAEVPYPMPRRTKPSPPAPPAGPNYEPAQVPFTSLRAAPYNARTTTEAQVDGICASIVAFGLVDPFILRAEDNLLIAGHQRQRAVQKLLDGRYLDPETKKPVVYVLPGGNVPVVLVKGLDEKKTKLLNLALNRVGGEWDDDKLADLFTDLSAEASGQELLVSGFTEQDIERYLGGGDDVGAGSVPPGAVRVPKITLEFSSKELRDRVKGWLGDKGKEEEPSGDTLARLLLKGNAKRVALQH